MIVTAIIMLIYCEISYFMFFSQLIEMDFVFGKSLLFYADNPYFFTIYKMLSLLFPTFLLKGTWKSVNEWL